MIFEVFQVDPLTLSDAVLFVSSARRKAQPATDRADTIKRKRKEFEGHKKKTVYREKNSSAPIVEISIEDDDLVNSIAVPREEYGSRNVDTATVKEPDSEQQAISGTTTSGATISDTTSSFTTISGETTTGTTLSGDTTSSAAIFGTIISDTISTAINAPANESVEGKSPEELPDITEGESSEAPKSQLDATTSYDDFGEEQGWAKTGHKQSKAKGGEEKEDLPNDTSTCNDTEMTNPVMPDRTGCDQDDQREVSNLIYEARRPNIDADSEGVQIDRQTCDADSKKGEASGSNVEMESMEGVRKERLESEDCVSIQSMKDNNIDDSDVINRPVSSDEASQPNIDAALEDVEIDRPTCDADSKKGETSGSNRGMESMEGMREKCLKSEDCVSIQSTKDYNDIDDSDNDVSGRPVSSKEAESLASKSAQSSLVEFERGLAPNPYHKFRAHFEKLEQMSLIEVLGFFRRFVTALIIYNVSWC